MALRLCLAGHGDTLAFVDNRLHLDTESVSFTFNNPQVFGEAAAHIHNGIIFVNSLLQWFTVFNFKLPQLQCIVEDVISCLQVSSLIHSSRGYLI
ncbi:hypothetical protein ES703_64178 [subsurface metagenome]